MMQAEKRPGRPAGDKRQALLEWGSENRQFTMGQLMRSLGWSVREANDTIRRAMQRNELSVKDKVPQPGCKRKVALYARPDTSAAQTLSHAMASWAR